jgi:hypothetical protein
MSEFGPFLDREARRIDPQPGTLDVVLRRAERRRFARRVASGVVALALAGGGIGLAYATFAPDREGRPASRPVPGPTPTAGPQPSPTTEEARPPLRIEVLNGIAAPGSGWRQGPEELAAGDAATALISGLGGVDGRPFEVTWHGERPRRPVRTTTIYCLPSLDHVAAELQDGLSVPSDIRPLIPASGFDLRVVLGDDFVRSNPTAVATARLVSEFMTARHADAGAEPYLSDLAARDYAAGIGGLSLYGYTGPAERSVHTITAMYPRGDGSFTLVVRLTYRGSTRMGHETLTVGAVGPEDGTLKVLSAELNEDPTAAWDGPNAEMVAAFVEDFLQARREASGAGTYLGQDARQAYASHEDGLDLLEYAAGDALTEARVVQYDKLTPARHRVVVRFALTEGGGPRVVWETLLIGWRQGDVFTVLDVERGRPG